MPGTATVIIKDKQWQVYLATAYAELSAGLKGADLIPPGTGMLLVLPVQQVATIDMTGMLFPLDVVFISGQFRVVSVVTLEPEDQPVSLTASYILEVNAGEAEGVEPGDAVDLYVAQAAAEAATTQLIHPVVNVAAMLMGATLVGKMGKTLADVAFREPKPEKERTLVYGPKGEMLLPHIKEREIEAFEDMLAGLAKKHNTSTTSIAKILLEHDIRSIHDLPDREKLDAIICEGLKVTEGCERDAFYWTAKNKKTGEVVMDTAPAITVDSALRAGEYYVKRNWKHPALVEVWDRPVELRLGRRGEPSHIIPPAGVKPVAAETVIEKRDSYYWTARNIDTGEMIEYSKAYRSVNRALSAARKWVEKRWPGDRAEVEIWDRPHIYSGEAPGLPAADVSPVKHETIYGKGKSAAVIPHEPRRPRPGKPELEFYPDSPEFLAYTIEDIGYRDKIDNAFCQAIARANKRR